MQLSQNAPCLNRSRWQVRLLTMSTDLSLMAYLCQHLIRDDSTISVNADYHLQTLFGAIPALTVNFVSLNTVSLISWTHSSAAMRCSSQYFVMLQACSAEIPLSHWTIGNILEIALVASGRLHVRIVSSKDIHDLLRKLWIASKMTSEQNEVWTELSCDKSYREQNEIVISPDTIYTKISPYKPFQTWPRTSVHRRKRSIWRLVRPDGRQFPKTFLSETE